ncbi:putative 28S ribosomal protein S18b, mitochondrial-like [Apostichopus japonicus]|uniref:Small ribosomal subunit protein mS40 n=1 Tax=Stichopus japonicus TaxID=307972 RepID=A0A2G8KAD4_STIJA|nr:putative 28S ribosomal protein S18b, mitochondrial-like [Apostichopus japonicus]PIK49582.1 putative 28S ribosomal protein S18b, mitochondrial-like [Apostichopus japonicus]
MAAPLGRYAAQKSFQQFHLLMSARMIPIWKGVGYTSWSQRPLLICQPKFPQPPIGDVATCNSYHTSSPVWTSSDLTDEELHKAKGYLNSEDYKERYQDKPVWANYKRNFKGQVPPAKTRKRCIRGNDEHRKVTSNACPICRDENLVVDYRNTQLLDQFICPHSWEIYSDSVTGVCQQQHKLLETAITKARSYGLIFYEVQKIHYNYEDYYKQPAEKR